MEISDTKNEHCFYKHSWSNPNFDHAVINDECHDSTCKYMARATNKYPNLDPIAAMHKEATRSYKDIMRFMKK